MYYIFVPNKIVEYLASLMGNVTSIATPTSMTSSLQEQTESFTVLPNVAY